MANENSKNWLFQTGKDFDDADAGLPLDVQYSQGFNRAMLDKVHAENMAGYMAQGKSEKEARKMADKRKADAMKGAKAAGLKL